ncbi:hypothetical protein BJX62DRAFT_8410 [Aspergillus germanicus]
MMPVSLNDYLPDLCRDSHTTQRTSFCILLELWYDVVSLRPSGRIRESFYQIMARTYLFDQPKGLWDRWHALFIADQSSYH